MEYEILRQKMTEGYSAFEKYIKHEEKRKTSLIKEFTNNSYFIYVTDEVFEQIMTGNISSLNQLEGNFGREIEDYNNAVYIQDVNGNDFKLKLGFSNIKNNNTK